MNKFVSIVLACITFYSCNTKKEEGSFTVNGNISNVENQRIFLEQLFFSQQNPQVIDTADVVNGKFTISGVGKEEGMYRLRLEKSEGGYVFMNDKDEIPFKADFKTQSLQGSTFSTPVNEAFKNFLLELDKKRTELVAISSKIEGLKTTKNNDSLIAAETLRLNELNNSYRSFIQKTAETTSSPNIAMFAIGNLDMEVLKTLVPAISKKFPNHQGVSGLVTQFNQALTQQNQPQQPQQPQSIPGIGAQAPEFTMADTSGKPVSLSQFKGKYVLVDFWASWCGPCRGENPNVVAAYNKFKNKNFTILGVSLDENKEAWLKAIKADKLTWQHVSDLQGWNNATVSLYGYQGIPYNVLLDPKGKIVATELRGGALEEKLKQLLN